MKASVTSADWFKHRPWIDEPTVSVEKYVKSVATIEDYDLKGKLESWRENGIVIFEDAVETAKIDALLGDVEYLVYHQRDFEITVEARGQPHCPIKDLDTIELLQSERLKINNLHTISRAALQCALNRFVASFLYHVFQEAPCVLQSLFFIRGSQQPVHLDYPYVCVQRHIATLAASWVALEDVHKDSGPLAYYCGSHLPEKIPFFDWGTDTILWNDKSAKEPQDFSNYLYAELRRLNIEPLVFLPRKGDVLIWHSYLAHEGTEIKDPTRTRKSLVTHYTSKGSYPSLHKYEDADTTGRLYSENRGIHYEPPWAAGWKMLPSWDNIRAKSEIG